MELPVVSARGVEKAFGAGGARRRVLEGADLDVWPGEFVAVLGRSGSGKSTLLHLLGGLERADAGVIEVAGVRVDRCRDGELAAFRRTRVGFVFQFFHLLPELTGAENVLLPARLGRGGGVARERGRVLIDRLGVTEAATRLPGVLSGGEQQRLALARALINEPTVLLADEPTGNLDEESGRGVLELLRQVAGDGRAVVIATHEREATAIADRVLVLRGGRLDG